MKTQMLAGLMSFALASSPLAARAEEMPAAPAADTAPVVATQPADASAEAAWREELKDAKASRARTKSVGVIAAVAGLGLMFAGNVRASSSASVDGCEEDGAFKVVCRTEEAKNEADDRISQGRALWAGGIVTGLVGLGFLISGAKKNGKVKELEETGRQKGYRLSLAPRGTDGVEILLSRAF